MFPLWPGLFGDNSALCTPIRARTLPKVLPPEVMSRIVHGSDFPISVGGFGPWRMGLLDRRTWRQAAREANVLERDVLLKRAVGFDAATFTRLAGLLDAALG